MNFIHKMLEKLIGMLMSSELKIDKIIKLKYDFMVEKEDDLAFLLNTFLVNVQSSVYDKFSKKKLIKLNKIYEKIDVIRQYLMGIKEESFKNKNKNYISNMFYNCCFVLIIISLSMISKASLINELLAVFCCFTLATIKSIVDTQKYIYECSSEYIEIINDLLVELDDLEKDVKDYIDVRTVIKSDKITLEKVYGLASSFDVDIEDIEDSYITDKDIDESEDDTQRKSSVRDVLNNTNDVKMIVREDEVRQEGRDIKEKCKVRKRKR